MSPDSMTTVQWLSLVNGQGKLKGRIPDEAPSQDIPLTADNLLSSPDGL